MIDYVDIPHTTETHYEYNTHRAYKDERRIKQQAFRMMKELDGWCTQTKAGFLMDLIFNHRPKVIVEVGIYGGKSLIPMAYAAQSIGGAIVYGIDPWKTSDSVVGFDDANQEWWGMLDHNMIMDKFLGKLKSFNLNPIVKILRMTSAQVDPIYDIDLIHIDGNHSEESALFDVNKWVPLVRPGGFIVFDDVDWATTRFATKWLDEHCYRITTFHEDNVWGVWMKPISQ